MAGHAQPLEHAARRRGRADGAGRAVPVGLAVRLRPAAEAVPLDAALKALPLRDGDHVDAVARLEDVRCDALAHLPGVDIVDFKLAQVAELAAARLQVAAQRLVQLAVLDRAV